jgi:hypothetical protein
MAHPVLDEWSVFGWQVVSLRAACSNFILFYHWYSCRCHQIDPSNIAEHSISIGTTCTGSPVPVDGEGVGAKMSPTSRRCRIVVKTLWNTQWRWQLCSYKDNSVNRDQFVRWTVFTALSSEVFGSTRIHYENICIGESFVRAADGR